MIVARQDGDPAQLLQQVLDSLAASGRALSSLRWNGQELEIEDLEQVWEKKAPTGKDLLEVGTEPFVDQLTDLLDALESGLGTMEEDLIDIADHLLRRDNRESLEKLSLWCSEMQQVFTNVQEARRVLGIDLSGVKLNDKDFDEGVSDFQQHLDAIVQAMTQGDRSATADLLEFEITQSLQELKSVFPLLKRRAQEIFSRGNNR